MRTNSTRNAIGRQYSPSVVNDISIRPMRRSLLNTHYKAFSVNGGALLTPEELHGAGIMDTMKRLLSKGKAVADKVANFATGDVGTAILNALPSSDENARPQFAGEKHGILKLPNGKYGRASYMGPGTQIEKRLKRGDPPRTDADKVAMAHDIRYAVGRSQDDIRKADNIMVKTLKDIEKRKSDNVFNTQIGMRMIQAKILGEKTGVLKHGQLANFGGIDEKDRPMLEGKLKELEQQGYGMRPGDMLRMKLLKKLAKAKKGRGLGLPGGNIMSSGGALEGVAPPAHMYMAKSISHKMLPAMLEVLKKGQGLKLAGQGDAASEVYMKMLKHLNDGASRNGKTVLSTTQGIKQLADAAIKVIKPILMKHGLKKMAGSGLSGRGIDSGLQGLFFKGLKALWERFKSSAEREKYDPRSMSQYNRGIRSQADLDREHAQRKGRGLVGQGFWSDFAKGFKMVFKPASNILGTAASALGMPEFGIPLKAVSGLL